jgi:dephospho-CoA kinase
VTASRPRWEPRRARPIRIGLTGPIGCGKSTIGAWLAERGAVVIDADQVAREVTAPGEPGHEQVLEHFGDRFRGPDGTLDRGALASLVFDDPTALRELEAIVHPLVRPRILDRIEDAGERGVPAVVIEAIKLVEGGLAELCDVVWFVRCEPNVQRSRLAARGVGLEDASRRMAAQGGMSERVAKAAPARVPVVDLETSATLDETKAAVAALWDEIVGERSREK